MPMRSQAQRAFLHINKPDIAKKFEAHTPPGAKLPKRVRHSIREKTMDSEIHKHLSGGYKR